MGEKQQLKFFMALLLSRGIAGYIKSKLCVNVNGIEKSIKIGIVR